MANIDNEWEIRLVDYTMGTMPPEEAARFEGELAECRAHVTLASQYDQVIGWLGATAPAAEPPTGHKGRLMARITATPQQPAAQPAAPALVEEPSAETPSAAERPTAPVVDITDYRQRRLARPIPMALGAVAAIVLLLLGALLGSQLAPKPTQCIPASTLAFTVQGQGTMQSASGTLLIDPDTNQTLLVANGLQPLPSGKVYELWLLPAKNNPVPAGTFNTDPNGAARHEATAPSNLANYTGVAVSVEPSPGVQQPTGPIVMAGNYKVP